MNSDFFTSIIEKINSFTGDIDSAFLTSVDDNNSNVIEKANIVVITASIDEFHSFSQYINESEIVELNNDSIL